MEVFLEGEKQCKQVKSFHGGVQSESDAADVGGRAGCQAEPGVEGKENAAVPLARCLPQGGHCRVPASGRATAAKPAGGSAGGGGAHPQPRTQGGATGDGDRFFAKSLQACKGVTPDEQGAWRNGIYGEIE